MIGFILSLVFSGIAGYIAGRIMDGKKSSSILMNVLLGIAGGFVGGILFGLIGFGATNFIGQMLVSVIGACICIWLWRKLRK